MRKNLIIAVFTAALVMLLMSCAAQKPQTMFKPFDFGPGLKSGEYFQTTDSFLFILDASDSMAESYKGQSKLKLAKDFVSRMNQTISPLKLNGALRVFGMSATPMKKSTKLIYGPTDYTEAGLDAALQTVKWAAGSSPLANAIEAAGPDLKTVPGKIAVILVSDGKEMDYSPLVTVNKLKRDYGDRLCVHSVLIGNDPKGKNLMAMVARASRCGLSVGADDLASSDAMAGFVKSVFFGERKIMDADGDGVTDDLDRCPDTPVIAKVDSVGCPLDSDRDGVFDYLDQCPGTPYGVTVDKWGCPADSDRDGVLDDKDMCPDTPYGAKVNREGCWVLKGIQFDSGKSNIKPEMNSILDEVAAVIQAHPDMKVEIQGHTDSQGAVALNQKLSQNRADAVMNYLVDKGVDKKRLSASGFGESRPIASNDTRQGRAMNRRVQLKPIY